MLHVDSIYFCIFKKTHLGNKKKWEVEIIFSWRFWSTPHCVVTDSPVSWAGNNQHLVQIERESKRAFVSKTHRLLKVHCCNDQSGGNKLFYQGKKVESQAIKVGLPGRNAGQPWSISWDSLGRNESSLQNACIFFSLEHQHQYIAGSYCIKKINIFSLSKDSFFIFPFMDITWYNAVWDHFSDSIRCVCEEGRRNAYQLTTGTEKSLVDTNTHNKLEQILKWSFSSVCMHTCVFMHVGAESRSRH